MARQWLEKIVRDNVLIADIVHRGDSDGEIVIKIQETNGAVKSVFLDRDQAIDIARELLELSQKADIRNKK